MKIVKKTAEHTIYERRDGRFAVKTSKGQPVNAEEKVAILSAAGYLKAPEPKVEEVTEEVVEEVAEEAASEEAPAAEEAEEAPEAEAKE